MYQLPAAPRGNGQVLESIIQLTRTGFVRLLPYAILTTLLSAVPFAYLLYAGVLDDPAALFRLAFSWSDWLAGLVMIAFSALFYGAAMVRIESIAQGADVGIGPSFSAVLPRVPALVGGMVGYVLAVAVGCMLLVVPGLWLAGALFLFAPAIALDGKGPIESLGHSYALALGNWWRLATIGGVALIMLYLVYLVVGILVGLFMGFRGADLAFLFMINMLTTLIGGLLMMPFFSALYVEMYRELKMRKQ